MAPHHIIDYVVVHELCHMLQHNHSPKYWQHVENVIPGYREVREWLKVNGVNLITQTLHPVNPFSAEISQCGQVLDGGQGICLKPTHLAFRRGATIEVPPSRNQPHHWITGKPTGVIDIFITDDTAK